MLLLSLKQFLYNQALSFAFLRGHYSLRACIHPSLLTEALVVLRNHIEEFTEYSKILMRYLSQFTTGQLYYSQNMNLFEEETKTRKEFANAITLHMWIHVRQSKRIRSYWVLENEMVFRFLSRYLTVFQDKNNSTLNKNTWNTQYRWTVK